MWVWLKPCFRRDSSVHFHSSFKDEKLKYKCYIRQIATSPPRLEGTRNLLNGLHPNILFTFEKEKQNIMSFLGVQNIRDDKIFAIFVYHKPTFIGVYIYFESFLQCTYKFGTGDTLGYRYFDSSWTKLDT